MPDDPNTTQDIPTSDSSPTMASKLSNMPPEAPEAPRDGFSAESNNSAINKGDAEISQPENEPKTPENQDYSSGEAESVEADKPTAQIPVNEPLENKSSLARKLLISARNTIQFRKRKKLDRVMSLFLQHSKLTNDEVEKYLHVSDATATRYLSILEKEGKIKQSGRTGKGVSYSRM